MGALLWTDDVFVKVCDHVWVPAAMFEQNTLWQGFVCWQSSLALFPCCNFDLLNSSLFLAVLELKCILSCDICVLNFWIVVWINTSSVHTQDCFGLSHISGLTLIFACAKIFLILVVWTWTSCHCHNVSLDTHT